MKNINLEYTKQHSIYKAVNKPENGVILPPEAFTLHRQPLYPFQVLASVDGVNSIVMIHPKFV